MPGLAVTSLTLSHFRSHKAARMELDGRPVAIHGRNGAGKTNILEAVSLLSPGRGIRRGATSEISRLPERLGWKVAATLLRHGDIHQIETWAQAGEARQVRIDEKSAPQTALGRLIPILWLVPAMDRLWIEGADGRRRFLDRMTLSFRPDHADAVLDYEKAMRDRNRLLKEGATDSTWFAALEAQMAEAGARMMSNRIAALAEIEASQLGARTSFPRADLQIVWPDDPAPPDAEAMRETLRDNRRRDMAAGRTLIGPHRMDLSGTYSAKGMAADQCSTGEQKALLISLVLANARALAERGAAPPILLLDEVAAHLDEGRRAALYDEVVDLGAQAFLTGTGPELFDSLGTRAQRFAVNETDGQSRVTEEEA
ncbi:DNA replication/repair protein RecF [Tabrizicola sp. J26]|uniref:DNA replication/repair protein RecF n=1 Tax=Alitabrizicola rongguiensis TaxID=2909234 RepID=UPI001F159018|nr:DNA replication/repair protein RecF [Tabrizicola rongguiensis]MCF1710649.1 DNA replication/repair protein RecF [Tabrizicola rongguiensis]